MAVPCDREPSPRPRLVREALIPLPPSVRRPFALIGASVALVFLAAVFDAVLWHYSLERDELRLRALSSEQRVVELEGRLHTSQIELIKQEIKLADSDEERADARRRLRELTLQAPRPCRESMPALAPVITARATDAAIPVINTGHTGKRR